MQLLLKAALAVILATVPSYAFACKNASWYGPGFHSKKTASGERFNQNALSAAHKTMKFGTKVKVTNLSNGKAVVVKINDRGPFIKGRSIDLSKAAALQIGMIGSGHACVKMNIIG